MDFSDYHVQAFNDKVMNADVVRLHQRRGHEVAFITTRPVLYAGETKYWLARYFGNGWGLAMRPDGNTMRSPECKKLLLEQLGLTADNVVMAYDDRQDVLQMYRELGITCDVLTYPQECPETVGDILRSMAQTFDGRAEGYGDTYLRIGPIMEHLFPKGLNLKTADDYRRYSLILMCVSKITRYCSVENGHQDSAHDLGVYAAMLESLTE